MPVVEDEKTKLLCGKEAVIDKDRASSLLAVSLGVGLFVISTDVDQVYLNYKQPNQHGVKRATADMMEYYLKSGQFPAGSMGPKIEAATRFIRSGGKDVFVTSSDQLIEAIHGKAGTHISARHEHEQEL